jgi:hypothetical protein
VTIKNNIILSVSFSFIPTESHELYPELYQVFTNQYDGDFSQYPVLCDKRSDLAKICKEKGNCRFLCLHQFFKTLNGPNFGVHVRNLVRYRTENEFHRIHNFLTLHLAHAIRDSTGRYKEARAECAKAGLVIANILLILIDAISSTRWEEVSQTVHVSVRLPPTTNSLENIHGHVNEASPRRNDF